MPNRFRTLPADPRDEHADAWDHAQLAHCRAFHAQHHRFPTVHDPIAVRPLRFWLHDQRAAWRTGRLSDQLFQGLDALGFDWDPAGAYWALGFKRLSKIVQSARRSGLDPWDQAWLAFHRRPHAQAHLSPERRAALAHLEPHLAAFHSRPPPRASAAKRLRPKPPKAAPQPSDDAFLQRLVAYQKKHDHLAIGSTDLPLYKWAANQRLLYRSGRADRSLVAKLQAIGFPLTVEAVEWEWAFSAFTPNVNGHRSGALSRDEWLTRQRALASVGQLAPERERRLRKTGAM